LIDTSGPTEVDLYIGPVSPSEFTKRLDEPINPSVAFSVARRQSYEHANAR
jgi:hypothetical protein